MTNNLVEKLREKYQRAAEKYGEKIFNLVELESRITHLLKTKGNVESFVKAEMAFYEKAMSIAFAKTQEIEKKKEANARINAILDSHTQKIRKYKDIFFDPVASVEVRKMVGAITDWYDNGLPLIKYLYRGAEVWNEIIPVYQEMERFYMPPGRPSTAFLRNYADEIRKMPQDQKENAERRLIQTCANSLYKMENLLEKEMQKMTDFQKARIINMSPAFDPEIREKWAKMKEFEALAIVTSDISNIIDDFRLRDLSALGFKTAEKNL
ncbi:MAG: hypothetical protein OEV66_03100 [Spirochaetia bacterium]|nr:hypothetical protein [Spirochaetia bacterium]